MVQAGTRAVAKNSALVSLTHCVKQGWDDAASIFSSPCAINMFRSKHLCAQSWSWHLRFLKTCCQSGISCALPASPS